MAQAASSSHYTSQIATGKIPASATLAKGYVQVENFIPEESAVFTPILHTIIGEDTTSTAQRCNQGILFPFTSPQLRTTFKFDSVLANLPALIIATKAKTVADFEFSVELGYILALYSSAIPVYSEPLVSGTVIVTRTKGEPAQNRNGVAISKQVQFQQQIQIVPGSTFFIEAIPYFRILEEIQEEIEVSNMRLKNARLLSEAAVCTINYEQVFTQ